MPSHLMLESAVAATPPPLAVGSRFVGYEIGALIGQGGHACVFHGHDPFMGQHVAIKVLYRPGGVTTEMLRRGQAEAQLLHRLRHPNIVEVSRAGIEAGLLFIVMELLRGRTLSAVLDEHGRLSVEEVLFLCAQIADAAAAAHDHKAIHRDLKPDNVFVTAANHVKVLDFGVAKLMDDGGFVTQKDIVVGTMLYMSPEQLQGLPLTPQSDIYALGLIMYTALMGIHPCLIGVQNPTFEELARIQVMRNPPALDELDPSIPSHVVRLVGRAVSKVPEERPASMREFAAEMRNSLERYVGEQRQQHGILHTRDLSEGGSSHWPPAGAAGDPATQTDAKHLVFSPANSGAALGAGRTAPLPRTQLASVAPTSAPVTPPPSSADKLTIASSLGGRQLEAWPDTAPPVARAVPPPASAVPKLALRRDSSAVLPAGVPKRRAKWLGPTLALVVAGLVGSAAGLLLLGGRPTVAASQSGAEPTTLATLAPISSTEAPALQPRQIAATTPGVEAAPSAAVVAATVEAATPAAAPSQKASAARPAPKPEITSGLDSASTPGKPAAVRPAAAPLKVRPIDVGSGLPF